MDAVARLARASKPTIYRRWPSKAALIVELYDLASEHAVQVGDLGSCVAELSALTRKTWSFWRDTMAGSIMRSIIAEAQGHPAALAQLRDEFVPARRRFARVIIERGIARGEICREVDVESLIDVLYGYAWYNLLIDRIAPEDYERAEATIVAIVTGLRPRRNADAA